ncbi:MAG TPA: alpha/beta hydrolase [Solirubrobacterales bacterium]|nr:alpha/beta hydrolase [Solirubrobacterales bacterium]
MELKTRRWGAAGGRTVLCVHGITQNGGVFDVLGSRLAARGFSVLAVDLRGHGGSGKEPPWDTGTHVGDLFETLDGLGVESATWIGHSFGGRLAAVAADLAPERVERIALLDPALEVPPARALRHAEMDRLDWSFATSDGAVNALLSSDLVVAAPQNAIEQFVMNDVRKGPDGRFRFRFCPSTAVVAWSESVLPAPPVAQIPTLIIKAEVPVFDISSQEARYEDELGTNLTWVTVPNGHNMLWESPAETIAAVESFLA